MSGIEAVWMSSDHFDGERFFNPAVGSVSMDERTRPAPTMLGELKRFAGILRWRLMRPRPKPWPRHDRAVPPWTAPRIGPGQIGVTYVGQDTFLLQLPGGVNLLTDPHWSDRAFPVSWMGPRRFRRPALRFEDLPPIAAVMVSHNHYDHLDLPTLRRLERAHHPRVFVPLGHRAMLERAGLRDIVELDWWQEHPLRDVGVVLTPAQHWSHRNLGDRNKMLWGGFVVRGPQLYFSGDTSFNEPMFHEIGERLGPISLSLLPIGTYEPRSFMRSAHMNPDDAVRAHIALGSRQSLGMHVSTFQLSDEDFDAPYVDLQEALRRHGVDPSAFRPPEFGVTEVLAT